MKGNLMKRIVIFFTLLSFIFADTARINVVNNLKGKKFSVLSDQKKVISVTDYKLLSRSVEVKIDSEIAVHMDGYEVFKSVLKLDSDYINTLVIDEPQHGSNYNDISVTVSPVKNKIYSDYADETTYIDAYNFAAPVNLPASIDQKLYAINDEVPGLLEPSEMANVQIIHNSPYPVVDIYVDNAEALGDVPYRASTGLLQIPTSTTVSIAPANGDIIANFPFTLESDGNYVVTAAGIVGNSTVPFGLIASGLEIMAVDSNHFGLKVFHGVTDAPAVDIYANGGLLVENLSYSEYAGYLQVPVGDYTIDVTAHGSEESVASFAAPLSGFGGGTGIVYASGFLASASDSAFSLILTTPSGYSVQLPSASTALSTIDEVDINPLAFSLNQNYPNPFNPSTTISFDVYEASRVSLSVYDLNGRLVKNLMSGNLGAGTYNINWNGKNTNGLSVAGGVYFYSITSGENSIIKKMSLIK